jgi:hypothetical protein
MQINKRAANRCSSFKASSEDNYVRKNTILAYSIIEQEQIKLVVRAHINRYAAKIGRNGPTLWQKTQLWLVH